MSAEVSRGLGLPEGAGKVDTTEANGRPHGLETAGGETIEPAVHETFIDQPLGGVNMQFLSRN